jgi:acyl-CoA reductase-like NAD-dependent aldehyde dehydrogenase
MSMKTLPDFWFEPRPWIDGQWYPGGETVTVRNPATAEKIADVSRVDAATVALAIEAGIVGVNEWRPLKAGIPFGGIKQSGIGAEGGEEGLREFLETQVISMPKPTLAT